jgi:beta-glucosidase
VSALSPDPAELAARLPADFVLGAATAAFQIEGAVDEGGRGPSVWDDFTTRPGRILDGSDASVAVDHFHRVEEDVALLRELGVDGYRFSISWPRIQPTGEGPANEAGLDFYERLVDRLLDAGIRPMATLFHWDTPLALHERGGWRTRETAERFADYAGLVGARLGDRVADWVTINEAATVTLDGYALGLHAPGEASLFRAIPVARTLLLAHGLAVQALRSVPVVGRIGITNVHTPVEPATDSRADAVMAELFDLVHNRLYADPVLLGRAPTVPRGLPLPVRLALATQLRFRRSDLAAISQPLDFYGLNYYFPTRIAAGADASGDSPDGHSEAMGDVPFHLAARPDLPSTGFGWPIDAGGLREQLAVLAERYGDRLPPIVVTENGASFTDAIVTASDGARTVDDDDRIRYLADHLAVVADAANGGVPGVTLEGYYVWSLLDNFEWAAGYTQRFGLVHVDLDTLERLPKRSFHWIAAVQAAR